MFFNFFLLLEHEAQLKDYEYVLHCYKFDLEPEFILVPKSELSLNLARSAQDDVKDSKVKPEDISPLDQVKKVSYEELKVLLETLDNECSRMAKVCTTNTFTIFLLTFIKKNFVVQFQVADQLADCSDTQVIEALRPMKVVQSVKAISAFVGNNNKNPRSFTPSDLMIVHRIS